MSYDGVSNLAAILPQGARSLAALRPNGARTCKQPQLAQPSTNFQTAWFLTYDINVSIIMDALTSFMVIVSIQCH